MTLTSAMLDRGGEPSRAPEPSPRAPLPSIDELGRFVETMLARPAQGDRLALVLPAPLGDGSRLLDTLVRTDAFAFAPPSGRDVVGVGTALRLTLSGPERFETARRELARAFATLETAEHPDAPRVLVRAFCGFAFAPGSADRDPWTGFGDGALFVPRWTYFGGPGRAALVCVLDRRGDHPTRAALVRAELEAIFAALASPTVDQRQAPTSVRAEAAELHAARVHAALAEIRGGAATKIVVSRRLEATASDAFDDGSVYRALVRGAKRGSTAFLVRRGGASFVGATPEVLLSLRGGALRTMALAGTAAPHGVDLLESAKDLAEHRVVVDAIVGALGPLATRVEAEAAPRVATAGPMLHLRTSIQAQLSPDVDALTVAARLHPTPAVAGAPRDVATRFIERFEPSRGWYTGPLGWIDSAGDAELVVALRAGLLRGGRAIAFAGGGIVEGSVAADECAETQLKMRPFLDALGAELP